MTPYLHSSRSAVGRPLADYLSEKIWQPMRAAFNQIAAGGYEIAFCCINAALRDWARLGMLLASERRTQRPADYSRSLGAGHLGFIFLSVA